MKSKRMLLGILLWSMVVLTSHGKIPEIIDIGVEEYAGPHGRLVNIATDSKNQPHIIADIGGSTLNYFYDRVGGSWRQSSFNSGGESAQSYNPHIEINNSDQAWYSVVKWWSHGMGVMIRQNMATAPSGILKYSKTTGGVRGLPVSNLSLDINSNNRCVIYGGNGGWYDKVRWTGSDFAPDGANNIGTLDVGPGGEKNYFWISRAGNFQHANGENKPVWHGCSDWSYNNSARKAAGKAGVEWIASNYYTYSGDDGCYPMVVSDNKEPQTAYLFADYKQFGGPGVMLQIWKGDNAAGDGHFVFQTSSLLNVDPEGTSGARRYEPQLAPAKDGGVWACYSAGSNIRIRYIPSNIRNSNQLGPITEFPGTRGAIAVDRKGNLHVAYINNGVRYRKITIAGGSGDAVMTTAGDYNGDGIDDLATYNPDDAKWYIKDTKSGKVLAFGFQWGFQGAIPVSGNFFNEEGEAAPKDDLCVYHPRSGNWYVNSGVGGTTRKVEWGYTGTIPVPADYDGDGLDDYAVYAPDTGKWNVLGANGQLVAYDEDWGGFPSALPLPADYDGDGKADLGIYDFETGKWYIRTTRRFLLYDFQLGSFGMLLVPGDYDGDGKTDPAVYNPDDGKWYVERGGNGGSILQGEQWGTAGMIPVPGDYDGDGKDDLALFYPTTGAWYIKKSDTEASVILWDERWGIPGMVPVPGDYDGDGKADLALYDPAHGMWFIKKAEPNGSVILLGEQWGTPDMTPVPGDYNGDGKADLALYMRKTGNWYIKPAVKGGKSILWGSFWGTPTMYPVSGDYDGDGKNDLAVCNSTDGKWYIRAADGKIITFGVTSGRNGHAVPGDYDGDGKSDITNVDTGKDKFAWVSRKASQIILWDYQWGGPNMIPVPGDYDGGGADLAVWDKNTGNWYIKSVTGKEIAWEFAFGLKGMHPISGDFNGDGISDLTFWDTVYWSAWEQTGPSWYSHSIAPTDAGHLLWDVQWGALHHIAIGSRN